MLLGGKYLNLKTDNELMIEYSKCSDEAFKQIVRRYRERLFKYAFSYLRIFDDAEDVTQETLINVFKSKLKYKPTFEFSTWIYTIERNLCINTYNRNNKVKMRNINIDVANKKHHDTKLQDLIDGKDRDAIISRLLSELDIKYATVIQMRIYEGLTYKEINQLTGINENTLKSRCKRGLKELEDKIKRELR